MNPISQNPILQKNLQAYCSRYPNDQKRIFEIVLRQVSDRPKLDGFDYPEPAKDYRCRLCFIVNCFSPDLWQKVVEGWRSDAHFIVEQNRDAIAVIFQTIDIEKYLLNQNFHFFFDYKDEEIIAPMQRILRHTMYAGKLMLSQVITPNHTEGLKTHYVDYARSFNQVLRKTIEHVYFNFGHIDDSIEGLRATFDNFYRIKGSLGITELENIHKGKAFVVVGAGPSLDHDIKLLAEHQDKYIIVAVDAAIKPLLAAGCRIDYVSTIERYNGFQEEFFRGIPKLNADLICYPVVSKDVIALYPDQVRMAYRNYAWFAYFEKNWPLGIFESGGSASHLAARAALHMGAAFIILVGCDMTYEEKIDDQAQKTYRSHCLSTAYPEWNRYKSEEEIRGAEEFYGFYDVEANDGTQVKTHQIYHQWAKEYSTFVMTYGMENKVLTAAKKGIKTPRLLYIPFPEIIECLPTINTEKKSPTNEREMAPIGHETIFQSLEGIYRTVTRALSALDHLLEASEIKTPEILKLCYQSLYEKMAHDTFFTAFIVQNCAMEFFRAEIAYYNVPDGDFGDEHYLDRVKALRMIFLVLEDITRKTLKVVEPFTEKEETHVCAK